MEQYRASSHPEPGGDRNPMPVVDLAGEVVSRMSRQPGLASIAMLVDCLTEFPDRLPHTFGDQIHLLNAIGQSSGIYLKNAGTESFVSALHRIISFLELCGELPCYPFATVAERVSQKDPFAARRYLEGLHGLASREWWGGAMQQLLAVMNCSVDRDLPFVWSELEWRDFHTLVRLADTRATEGFVQEPLTPYGSRNGERGAVAAPTTEGVDAVDRQESNETDDGQDDSEIFGESDDDRIRWTGSQTDLVAIVLVLKQARLIDPTTSDATITKHFDYGTKARNPGAVLRQSRRRLLAQDAWPTEGKIEEVISKLQQFIPKPAKG